MGRVDTTKPGITTRQGFNAPASDFDWVGECNYIERVTALRGNVPEMNRDKATFVRYCEMQRDIANRQGRFDSATFIQHCLDDLTKELHHE